MSEYVYPDAVVFDISDEAQIELTGPDAARYLHNLCTNDIVGLQPDRGCEAFFCTAKAKVVGHAVVWNLSTFWLHAGPGPSQRVFKHLDHYLISERVEITDRTAELARLRVVGPKWDAVVRTAMRVEATAQPGLWHTERGEGEPAHLFGHDLLARPAVDLVVPRGEATALYDLLLAAGAHAGDAALYEVLRVEAGLPLFGKDLDENRFVAEVGRTARAISYTKGCYLGQEPVVMARDRGHVNRFLVGLTLSGEVLPGPGAKVFHGDREVGLVTSSVRSPRLGPIALGYVWRGSHEPGTAVRIDGDVRCDAVVTGLPF